MDKKLSKEVQENVLRALGPGGIGAPIDTDFNLLKLAREVVGKDFSEKKLQALLSPEVITAYNQFSDVKSAQGAFKAKLERGQLEPKDGKESVTINIPEVLYSLPGFNYTVTPAAGEVFRSLDAGWSHERENLNRVASSKGLEEKDTDWLSKIDQKLKDSGLSMPRPLDLHTSYTQMTEALVQKR